MSKSKIGDVVAAELPGSVVTLEARIASHVANVLRADTEANDIAKQALEAVGKARNHALSNLVTLWNGAASLNDVAFDASVKETMFKAYQLSKAYKNDAAIRNRMAFDKVTVIALTNGILPNADETQQVFAKRVGPTLKTTHGTDGKALYTPKTGSAGGRKAKEPSTSDAVAAKGVEMTRTMALNVLCKGDQADMQALDFLTSAHMATLRVVYASLNPIKIK